MKMPLRHIAPIMFALVALTSCRSESCDASLPRAQRAHADAGDMLREWRCGTEGYGSAPIPLWRGLRTLDWEWQETQQDSGCLRGDRHST